MQINIYTNQVNLFDDMPLNHVTHCPEGKCPSGEAVCCFECGDRTCKDRCDNSECHIEMMERHFR